MTGENRPSVNAGATAASAPPTPPVVIRPGAVERLLQETHDRKSTFASEEFLATVREDLAWEGLDEDVVLLSLDVFDTVLIREDVSEIRRFWEIAKLIAERLESVDARDLLVARLTATRASYRCSMMVDGYREGELDEIHRLALSMLGLDAALAELAVTTELEYEAAHLTANPAIRPLWESWGRPNCVAVSNMYLSAAQIRHLLESNGVDFIATVYSSTESKMSKNDTRLLRRAMHDAEVSPSECVHIGDSYFSDFVPARRLGWFAQWWPASQQEISSRRADAVACLQELEMRVFPSDRSATTSWRTRERAPVIPG